MKNYEICSVMSQIVFKSLIFEHLELHLITAEKLELHLVTSEQLELHLARGFLNFNASILLHRLNGHKKLL